MFYKNLLIFFLLFFSCTLYAAQSSSDYWLVNTNDKEEISEENVYFTWLGCDSCLMIEQKVDLSEFTVLPLIARPDWRPAAKIQMALSLLKVEKSIVEQFKQKILDKEVSAKDMTQMTRALAELGVEQEALETTLASTELFSAVRAAENKAKFYGIRYAPTAVVKGRYATDAKHTKSINKFSETLEILKTK